jgi:hypothetical protein
LTRVGPGDPDERVIHVALSEICDISWLEGSEARGTLYSASPMTSTIEDRYKFLLSKLVVTGVDAFENDALIALLTPIYFQFSNNVSATQVEDVDWAIDAAIATLQL